jgi:D-hydroxyproline dehydrogenase subunit gamma
MRRIEEGVERPEAVEIEVNGERVRAYPGESLAAALLAGGLRTFRETGAGQPRGPWCNMGVCFDCLVEANGVRVRACATAVRAGMRVRTGAGGPG